MARKLFGLFGITILLISVSVAGITANSKEKTKKDKKEDRAETKAGKEVEYYEKGRSAYLLFTPKGFKDAIEYYKKAIEVNPNFAPAYAGLGEVYSYMGYYKLEVREDYEEDYNNSYKNMVKALKLGADTKECQRALALTYLHLRRLKEAEATARRVIEQYPNDAESYYILWAATGRDPDSPLIRKALELDPKLVVAHIGLGSAYFFNKGNYKKATEHYKMAMELAESPELHNYLGTSLRTEGYLGQALSHYQKAIELDPNYAVGYMNLGITLFYMNKYKESIENLKKSLSLNPNYPDTYYHLARVYEKTKNDREAVANYQTFIKLTSGQQRFSSYIASARESLARLNGK